MKWLNLSAFYVEYVDEDLCI